MFHSVGVKWYQNLIILFCYFSYFFPFKAYGFDPRLIVFLLYFYFIIKDSVSFAGIKVRYIRVLLYPSLMFLFTIFASLINNITENTFIIFPLQITYLLLLSYCIYYITRRFCKTTSYYTITNYFIAVLVIQSIIAIVMFVSQPICSFLFELQGIDVNSRAIQMYFGMRLIGLGCFYFGAGVIYGLGLICLMPLMLNANNKQLLMLMALYAYLFIIGVFFARTTIVGAAISFLYLFFNFFVPQIKPKAISVSKKFMSFVLIAVIALVSLYSSSPKLQEDYADIINFGFEAFINLSETGEFSTKSSDGLKEYHLNIWPENLKTYYVGDTRWTDGDSYYGDSDVGYIRLLYYFGIPGIILFLLYQYSVMGVLRKIYRDKYLDVLFAVILLYAILLLIKGYVDTAALMFILLHHKTYTSRNENFILC